MTVDMTDEEFRWYSRGYQQGLSMAASRVEGLAREAGGGSGTDSLSARSVVVAISLIPGPRREVTLDGPPARLLDTRSTLERGSDIEADFYRLKAQEWAASPEKVARTIKNAMNLIRGLFP